MSTAPKRLATTQPEGDLADDERAAPAELSAAAGTRWHSYGKYVERYGLLGAWAIEIVIFSFLVPAFHQITTIQIILSSQTTQIVVTLAVLVGLIGGEFDLSVSNVLAYAGAFLAMLNTQEHLSIVLSIVIVLAGAAAFGMFNALVVLRSGIPSIIITLGSGTLLAGIGEGIAGVQPRGGVSPGFVNLVSKQYLGLPVSFYIAVLIGLLLYYWLQHTPAGRHFSFVGRNRDVARLTGLHVSRLRAIALITCSVLAALAGVLLVGSTGASDPTTASSYLLPALAGAFLGSTVIRPGQFNIAGTFIAVYFLVTGVVGLDLAGYSGWVQDTFYGASLLVAVVSTQIVVQRTGRASTVLRI
jgi:ribose transport system permease protein